MHYVMCLYIFDDLFMFTIYVAPKVDPDQSLEDVKKKFRRMSILVHPDKNQGDADRAQLAFDAVKRAWNLLEEKETRKACLEVVEEAKGRTNINMEEKRRKLRKEGKPQIIEEDNPVLFKKAVSILTMKLFADLGELNMFMLIQTPLTFVPL